MGPPTPTWDNLPRRGPTYPDIRQVGPCVTKSAESQTELYYNSFAIYEYHEVMQDIDARFKPWTLALPFINITNLGNIWTLGLNHEL